MAGFSNSRANKAFLRKRFNQSKAAGERLVGADYWMVIRGYEHLSILIRTTQLGEFTREDVEDYAPSGVKINQHGVFRNQGEFQFQCAETIEGDVLTAAKEWVLEKVYLDIDIYLASESKNGEWGKPIRTYEMVKLYCDAVDMAAEDVTAIVRPSMRAVYNWQE
ncbi:baseplate protein [Xenorhabdus sp. XENO-10]|uniref:Baseplate protein n=1 Tax=Xenorhabdus yunnanensis TaxID=3025878 RepID=A0ABT5LI12_9GAMM|nr:baseplate protein [Xenorhabdus yunnanensis]MDC9590756.1 baseplate protein [Xenorhabdus yunnanensis]